MAIVTQGEESPTATLQAFAATSQLEPLFIMADSAEKFQNLLRGPKVTVIVDGPDVGDVSNFKSAGPLFRASPVKFTGEPSGIP